MSTNEDVRDRHAERIGPPLPPLDRDMIVAFVGPTVRQEELEDGFPDVTVLPPARQGDVLSVWARYRPSVIVVIDGEFGQSLSVWHKEILQVIDHGCHVVGAASMGALRAAELERFGMIGVGDVFRHYSGAFLTADDDVALLHAGAEDGWRPLTWPMVNCRATVRALESTGRIDADTATTITRSLQAIHFSRRMRSGLEESLRERDVAGAAELSRLFESAYVDQKRADAIAALELAHVLRATPRRDAERPRHLATRLSVAMHDSDTLVVSALVPLHRYQLVNDVALHEPDFEAISQRSIDRLLVLEFAAEIGVRPTEPECRAERARFLAERQLSEDSIQSWLVENDLHADEFDQLIVEEATRRRMQRWALDARQYGRNRKAVLDQLRLEGRYGDLVRHAAQRKSAMDRRAALPWPQTDRDVHELVRRHHEATGWRPPVSLATLAEDHGFENVAGLILALLDAERSRDGDET